MSPGSHIIEWIQANDVALAWVASVSTLLFLGTLAAVPWLVTRIPHDYFTHRRRLRGPWADRHPALRGLLIAAKNLLGAVFVVVGLAMLVLPGQGVLTILAGVVLLDLPGKYRLERWVVTRPSVLRSVNWLRRRAGRPPLVLDESDSESDRGSAKAAGNQADNEQHQEDEE